MSALLVPKGILKKSTYFDI